MAPMPIVTELTLNENHIKLLGRSYYDFSTYFYEGCVSQDPKRPYGNSDVLGDLYEIIYGEKWDDEDEENEMSGTLQDELKALHQQMGVVVQILALSVAHDFPFEVGREYIRGSRYDSLSWRAKNEEHPRPARRALFTSPGWGTIQ